MFNLCHYVTVSAWGRVNYKIIFFKRDKRAEHGLRAGLGYIRLALVDGMAVGNGWQWSVEYREINIPEQHRIILLRVVLENKE